MRWQRNHGYFKSKSPEGTRTAVIDFAKKYNCKYNYINGTMICSEEDFLIIKLTCSDAIQKVYKND